MALSKPIPIEKLNQGGISDSIYAGARNSAAAIVGWDLHSTAGLLKVRQALAQDDGDVVDEFCKVALECSNGDIYFFSSESGKIWKVGSPYTLVHTTTPNMGSAACLGACEYAGFIYWFTEDRGHRIPANDAALSDWSTNAQEDVLELDLDQAAIGSTGDVYTLTTGVNEGATHQQSFVPFGSKLSAIAVHITTVGSGNWTVAVHDSDDTLVTSKAISNGSLSTGFNIFEFGTVADVFSGDTYHVHIYSSVADGEVTASDNEDLETGYMKIHRTSDSEFHPAIEHFGVMYIGDRNFIHQVRKSTTGSHVFTTEALDLEEPLRVKCLGKAPLDLLIGTITSSTLAKTQMIKWNTYSESFTSTDEIPEVGINAFIPADNFIIVHAGLGGSLYIYDGQQLQPYKKIQGTYTPTAKATIHPNAVGMLDGISLFGLSDSTGDPALEGIYALGRYSRDYPIVYDLSFPVSEYDGDPSGSTLKNGIEIGAIIVSGYDVYVSWKSDSKSGAVDKLDYSTKLDGAYIDTMVLIVERSVQQNYAKIALGYQNRPSGTSFTLKYDKNHAGSFTEFNDVREDTDRDIYYADDVIQANTLQVRIIANTSSNDAPDFESAALYLSQ